MKLGPVHLITDSTWRRLKAQAAELTALRARVHAGAGGEAAVSFLHPPAAARLAPPVALEPDPASERSREAVTRVVEAYHRAVRDFVPASPSHRDEVGRGHPSLITALRQWDFDALQADFARLFQTRWVRGLGRADEDMPEHGREDPDCVHSRQGCTDTLISLAEAVGVARVVPAGRLGAGADPAALDVDLDRLLRQVERKTGLDLSVPAVGAASGCRVAGKLINADSLRHGYAVWRLRQLGARPGSRVVEVGGGYGGLAALCQRAGHRDYTILDLPWVNALQGYYLIMALPPGSVRLHGEKEGGVAVLPYWCIDDLPRGSADFVVSTHRLPEVGAEAARKYVAQVRRVLRGLLLSVNQEGNAGPSQNGLADLVEEEGHFRVLSRGRYWMAPGCVEEVFAPEADVKDEARRSPTRGLARAR